MPDFRSNGSLTPRITTMDCPCDGFIFLGKEVRIGTTTNITICGPEEPDLPIGSLVIMERGSASGNDFPAFVQNSVGENMLYSFDRTMLFSDRIGTDEETFTTCSQVSAPVNHHFD